MALVVVDQSSVTFTGSVLTSLVSVVTASPPARKSVFLPLLVTRRICRCPPGYAQPQFNYSPSLLASLVNTLGYPKPPPPLLLSSDLWELLEPMELHLPTPLKPNADLTIVTNNR